MIEDGNNGFPERLGALGVERRFLKGDHIFRVGEAIGNCYLILKGTVKIYIDHENGRRSILDFASGGSWLGELSLFCEEDYIKENQAVEETVCLEFNLRELRRICKEEAEVSFYFASYISKKLMARSGRMSEYLNYSLEKRLAAFILEHQQGGKYNLSHTDVSEYLNVSYRHVLYVMKKFCNEGLIAKEKGYSIVNEKRLKEISDSGVS
ncbi:cyclic nucleotide-binding domain-containing protein [Lacrimispora algidixylanolytica]|uniref:Crp/Fnr family transcriptional regulator n=1 Tax=Lacrimispora algidixylanolytica TaxID=94868 RepID=A0A419T6D2_9FIRM|nr:cyclic nucleotide-binding domain-containing protein [Lacrimispora algidixylanolytica]RKD33124.1 Crp/Fnr family transcriptional regulator [Lacrimispora algidixylanolytica]